MKEHQACEADVMIVTSDNGMITEGEQLMVAVGVSSTERKFTAVHIEHGHDKTKAFSICSLRPGFVGLEVGGHPSLRLALRR